MLTPVTPPRPHPVSPPLESEPRAPVHALWDRIADFPVSKADSALRHLHTCLGTLIRADNAMWIGAVRMVAEGETVAADPLHGWRSPAMLPGHQWKPDPANTKLIRDFLLQQKSPSSIGVGHTTMQLMAGAGTHRVHRLRDGWIDFEAFRKTAHYDLFYHRSGVADRLWVAFPVNDDTESIFVFDRLGDSPRFTEEDAALAAYALRGLKWFHRHLLLRHGLRSARGSLSPSERRIIPLLLTGLSEKEIACELQLGFSALHKHVNALYKKFSVSNRASLMTLWFGH